MANHAEASAITRWQADPCAFIREVLINYETAKPFELYQAEQTFLRRAFNLDADGHLKYPELLYSAPKKSGKTHLAALTAIYVAVVLSGMYGEIICAANDYEQAQSRVFQSICRIIQASPLLRHTAKVTGNKVTFTSTGTTVTAISSDFAGAAGSNPNLVVFDELWGYQGERSQRLWDELVPVPTRKVSARLTVTYAGFTGESTLLEGLYKRGLEGEEIAPALYRNGGLLMFWSHSPVAPWQTPRWLSQMREQHRPNAYLRQIENRWVTSESSFIDMAWFDACVDADAHPLLAEPNLPVWVGVDASVKRDSTAIVCAAFVDGKVRLIWHRIFQPSPDDPLDFEATIEKSLLELRRRFYVREVKFDPFQLVAVAQRLVIQGLPMVEFPQSVPNLTEASSNLYELIKGKNLVVYADDDLRLAISRAVAVETSRGWRISKETASHKIDVVIALAQAALGAVREGQMYQKFEYTPAPQSYPSPTYPTGEQVAAEEDRQVKGFGVLGGRMRFPRRGAW